MKEMNHKISRQVVCFALANGVGVIQMEELTGIRKRAASAKEAGRSLHSWAFRQLQTMIAYKAEMAGIRVEWVKPTYTSQTCRCGHRGKANRNVIRFRCQKCGCTLHVDLNGAINIAKAISGFTAEPSALVTSAPPIGVHLNPMGRGDGTPRSFCVVRTRNG